MPSLAETKITAGRWKAWLFHPPAVLLLAACFAYGVRVYDSLPETIPTHWGAGGRPDAWETKSFSTVFLPLMIGTGASVLLALIAAAAPLMAAPAKEATEWELYRREGMIRGTVAGMGVSSLLLAALIGFMAVAGWEAPDRVPLWPALVLGVLILAGVLVSYQAASRWARRTALRDGISPTAGEQEEGKLWIAGILYNNPDDPHILVPKRDGAGTGLTMNVGNSRGRAAVVVFLLVFVAGPLILGLVLAL